MKKQIAQYLYDISDVYSLLHDAIDGISDSHIQTITESTLHAFLSCQLLGAPIDHVYHVLELYTPESHVADIISELTEWYDYCVGFHLRSNSPANCNYGYNVSQRTDLTVTIYTDVPPAMDEVGKIKQLIRNDLDNGDFYPENIRHALGIH